MPRVSIGLPVFNGEQYIEQSVRSVLDQTFDDLELIVSDNASTDRTLEIVRAIAAHDDRITVIANQQNEGAAWNYNAVFERASGEFFRWHAHDDWLEPDLLAELVGALEADPKAVLAYSWTRFIDDDGNTERVYEDDLRVIAEHPRARIVSIVRRLGYCNAVFGLIRRDVLGQTALIAPFPGSDVALLYELAVRGRFVVVPEPLFVRRPGASIKANPSTKSVAEWFDPRGRGRRLPGIHLCVATTRATWRSDHRVAERVATTVAFARVWPLDYARRIRRRRARRQLDGS